MNSAWESYGNPIFPYSNPKIYVRCRARRRHRGSDLSVPTCTRFHWQSRFPSDGYNHPSDYLPFLSYTFHCYLTYDTDRFRGADQFPGWDSLCLDHVPDFGCVQVSRMCHRSRIPIPCLLMRDLRSAHNPCSAYNPCSASDPFFPRLHGDTHTVHCPGARPIDRIPGVYM